MTRKSMSNQKAQAEVKEEPKALTVQVKWTEDEENNPAISQGRVKEYTIPPGEEYGAVHVELERFQFDNATMKKRSKPFIAKYDTRTWESIIRHNLRLQGWTHIRVLYAPEGVNTECPGPKQGAKMTVK